MEDLKSGIEHLRQAKAHMSKANGIMSNHISKLKELEEENAGLRAKLEAFIQSDDSYMRLPLDADGEPIHIGDVLYSRGNECRVVSITVKADEACVGVHTDEGVFLPSVNPKYLSRKSTKPLEFEVLDVGGVPIKVGDTVYCDDDPEQLIVDSFDDPGCVYLTLAKSPNGILYTIEPSRLSHECPDSWAKLEEDASVGAQDYCANWLGIDIRKTLTSDDDRAFAKDIIRRAKKLAGIEEEAQR